jgi:hypothetical protein
MGLSVLFPQLTECTIVAEGLSVWKESSVFDIPTVFQFPQEVKPVDG